MTVIGERRKHRRGWEVGPKYVQRNKLWKRVQSICIDFVNTISTARSRTVYRLTATWRVGNLQSYVPRRQGLVHLTGARSPANTSSTTLSSGNPFAPKLSPWSSSCTPFEVVGHATVPPHSHLPPALPVRAPTCWFRHPPPSPNMNTFTLGVERKRRRQVYVLQSGEAREEAKVRRFGEVVR